MVDKNKKTAKNVPEGIDDKPRKARTKDLSTTNANGGTRSSPPRVAGNGSGEAKGEKAKSASVAKQTAAQPKAETASTSGKRSTGGQTTSKRNTR